MPVRTGTMCAMALLCAGAALEPGDAAPTANRFAVTRFGANGQDAGKDTVAFQKAVDACAAAGGGVVTVPPGTYVLGRVILKDNVTLELEAGATVRPSTEKADYPPVAGSPLSAYQAKYGENALSCRYAVFYACGAKNVSIQGHGTLQGDGKSFWTVKNTGDFPKWSSTAPWHYYTPNAFRPVLLILEECENCTVRDITIADSPCYSGWFAGCRRLRFANVTVLNDPAGPNSDGFHFSSCRDVHLTDCDFVCGDDCIAIDPNHHGPAANFTITGCTFRTTVNVFRIYTGLDPDLAPNQPRGQVHDISASNCTVSDASGIFNVTAERGDIQRLSFSNFTANMDLRGSAFFFLTLSGGAIRDVSLNNMAIRADGPGVISGEGGGTVQGITVENVRYQLCPRTKRFGNGLPEPIPSYAVHHFAPYNLYLRYAADVKLHNVQLDWGEADLSDLNQVPDGRAEWSALECRAVQGLEVDGLICRQYGAQAPAVQLTDVRDALLTRCRAQDGTATFLRLQGKCANVALQGNDLTHAACPFALAKEVEPQALFAAANRAAAGAGEGK